MATNELGPLALLVGSTGQQRWKGNKGVDLAPDPDGIEKNLYEDEIIFTDIGEVENAEEQVLMAVRYHQQVHRITDNKLIHDQTGYWLWEQGTNNVTHSFSISRGLCAVATGKFEDNHSSIKLNVKADLENSIVQIPFLNLKAKTHSFDQSLEISESKLSYEQSMQVDIYGRMIDHTDVSELKPVRQSL